MSLQQHTNFDDHAEVMFVCDPPSGLRAIIALHRIWQKPSVGGCRLKSYASDDEAMGDVLRLSRGMTYKSVMAGLTFGGAKAVILSAPDEHQRAAQMRAMAQITQRIGGRFRTGVDFGLNANDIEIMQHETPFVFGDSVVPPSKATAQGVLISMKTAVKHRHQRTSLQGLRVAVAGLGKVGMRLAEMLNREGAIVFAADVNDECLREASQTLGVQPIDVEGAHAADVDVYCPCALGAVLNESTIRSMRASIIVGSANNQLAEQQDGERLSEQGILYAPDYIVNAGGLLAVAAELEGESTAWINQKLDALSDTLSNVFDTASKRSISPDVAADLLAEQRIATLQRSCSLESREGRSSDDVPAGGHGSGDRPQIRDAATG